MSAPGIEVLFVALVDLLERMAVDVDESKRATDGEWDALLAISQTAIASTPSLTLAKLRLCQVTQAVRELTSCVGCGCTDMRACPGGCFWVVPGLCSVCAEAASGP